MAAIASWLGDLVQAAVTWLASVLPASPIQYAAVPETVQTYLGFINYFIPLTAILAILQAWLVAVAAYYVASAALRVVKAIQ